MPGAGLERCAVSKHRAAEALIAFDPVIVEPADIAHPVAVDVRVVPRRHANQTGTLRPLGFALQPGAGVAALRTHGAHRVHHGRVVPGPALEAVVARENGADRAHIHEVSGQERVDTLLLERRDLASMTAIDDADLRVTVDLLHETDASRAQDAAIAVQHQRRTEIDVRFHALSVEHPPRKIHAALGRTEGIGIILEGTLAALVAHRAVERVIDKQELEHAGACFDHLRHLRENHHSVRTKRRTRRLQLGHLLDLDDADAAGTVDADAGVIAVIGDGDPGFDRRLQYRAPLRNRDRTAVYRERDGFHSPPIISILRLRPGDVPASFR